MKESEVKWLLQVSDVAHTKRGEVLSTLFPDLQVQAGRAVCIQGKSGSGKGLLLKIAAGLIVPASGKVQVADVAKAFVFSEMGLFHHNTAAENLRVALLFTQNSEGIEERIQQALRRFDLLNIEHQVVNSLPEPPKKLLQYARAEVLQPKLLFIQEPLKDIRADISPTVQKWLADFVTNGGGCVFSSLPDQDWSFLRPEVVDLTGGSDTKKTMSR